MTQSAAGYENDAAHAGYKVAGAPEMVESKVEAMLSRLLDKAETHAGSIKGMLAFRDGFAICLLWATAVSPMPTPHT